MKLRSHSTAMLVASLTTVFGWISAQEAAKVASSYSPVVIQEDFAAIMARMSAAKPGIMQRQRALLEERYDLSNHPAHGVTMSRGKPVQEGVRVKLRAGMTWDKLAQMTPEEVCKQDVFPLGMIPCLFRITVRVGCSFPRYRLTRSTNRKGATSPASIWISTCPIT